MTWILLIVTGLAMAQTDLVADKPSDLAAKGELANGWTKKGLLGLNLSLMSSSNVVGQEDGDSKTFGLNSEMTFTYKQDQHESRTKISLKEAQSSAPPIKRWIKSGDDLTISSIYLYSLESHPWLGPYVRGLIQTPVFKGEHVVSKDNPVYYSRDGVTDTTETLTSTKLTDPFKPLTTKFSLGAFAKAVDSEKVKLMFRLGYGAVSVSADGGYTVDDDAATTNIVELKSLKSYSQSGLETGMEYENKVSEGVLVSAYFETLTPLSGGDIKVGELCYDCSTSELTDISAGLKVSSKLANAISMIFEHKYVKQPRLVEGDQVQTTVMANFDYQWL